MARENIYLPRPAVVDDIREETPDVKTFRLHLEGRDGFTFRAGQFVEVSVLGVGECPICLASSPTRAPAFETTVRAVGSVTNRLHQLRPGERMGIRGPFGNGFPFEEVKGRDILFVGGGIGLPPLRSLIDNMLDNRSEFGRIVILYGARTPADLVYKQQLKEWGEREDVEFHVTVDVGDESWSGNVGVVTTLFPKIEVDPARTTAFTCGPPIMIRFVIMDLLKMGFTEERIISSLERYMKCGVGKCGHCAIGHTYVCVDGPIFSYAQIRRFREE